LRKRRTRAPRRRLNLSDLLLRALLQLKQQIQWSRRSRRH
jgi:hypothetical protein